MAPKIKYAFIKMKNSSLSFRLIFCIFLGLINWNLFGQIQIGNEISGVEADDRAGEAVAISSDGIKLAIGAGFNDCDYRDAGHVRMFRYMQEGEVWENVGNEICGEDFSDASGASLDLSDDGTIVAIGAFLNDDNGHSAGHVRIYKFNTSNELWEQMGNDIDGERAFDFSGFLALSSNGKIVAIGAGYNDKGGLDAGQVRIFGFNAHNQIWQQIGNDILGETAGDLFGGRLSLSADGARVAISGVRNDGNGIESGHVRVYELDSLTNVWQQMGSDIDGQAAGDLFGIALSISADGSVLAIGAIGNDGNGNNAGHVQIYRYNTALENWLQSGVDINGERAEDKLGSNLSLSGDGSILAISATENDAGNRAGHVRIFKYNLDIDNWSQIGEDIEGESAGDGFGIGLSISENGKIVAIGASHNDKAGVNSGHVKVYDLSAIISANIVPTLSQWSVVVLMLFILIFGVIKIRRANIINSVAQG